MLSRSTFGLTFRESRTMKNKLGLGALEMEVQRRHWAARMLLVSTIWACSGPAVLAQEAIGADPTLPFYAREGGSLRLGASTRADTSGDKRPGLALMPSVEYHWANGWMIGTDHGVAYNFSKEPGVQYGLGLGADLGRRATSTGELAGMGGIDAQLEYTGFAMVELQHDWRVLSALRYGAGDNQQGAVLELGVNYSLDVAPRWRAGLNLGAKLANQNHMQTYWGVSSSQSASSGHAVYTPSGGLSELNAGVNLNHQITPRVSVSTGINAISLQGDARNSPLVTKPDSLMGTVSIGYSF